MEKAIIPVGFASEFIEEKINFGESVAILSGAKKKAKTNEPFAIVFYRALLEKITELKLSNTDLKTLLAILDFVSAGNVVSLTHEDVAKKAKINRPQATNSIKKLLKAELLMKNESGSLFLNPLFISKTNLEAMKKSEAYAMGKKTSSKPTF